MGNYIFYNCTSLASATIGNDIRKIDSAAFCNCTSLTEIKIGNSVTSIGDYAFYNCTSLTSITIPSNVTSIGYYAFRYCENLESITLPFVGNALNGTSNTHFGYIFGASSYSYNNDYIPTSLKEVIITKSNNIGNYTFYQCTNLETIIIPNTVTSIGNEAFYNCTNLTSVTIPNSVTSIGENAFSAESNISPLITNLYINDIIQWYKINFANETANPMWRTTNVYYKDSDDNYSLLKNLVIPNDIGEKIKQYTFINYDFTSITISDNTEISINAFSNGSCKKLIFADNSKNLYCNFIGSDGSISTKILFEKSVEEIIIPFSITNIRVSDLNNCIKLKNIIVDSKNEKYSSEDGVLFYNGNVGLELVRYPICNEMINYNIPNGVVVIGNSAFESCKSLKSVTIPNSVVNILSNAFRYCYLLKSIDIPKKVKYIYNYTFQGCEELKEITITNNIISIAEYAFDGCESLSIVYYKGKKDDIIFNEDNITIGKKIITIGEYNNALKLANWVFIPTLNGFIITEGNERKNIIEAYVIAIDNDTKILKPINNVLLK